jgi:hypothetical protein
VECGFFRRYDITHLPDYPFVIQLGHEGKTCPFVSGVTPRGVEEGEYYDAANPTDDPDADDSDNSDADEPLWTSSNDHLKPLALYGSHTVTPFIINLVDLNGVHTAKLQYCRCSVTWRETKAQQLLQAGFFPATPQNPGTAFSFQILKHYQNHSPVLYQFTEGLRKDTDSALPSDVPVSVSLMLCRS